MFATTGTTFIVDGVRMIQEAKRTVMDARPVTVKYDLTAYGSTLKPIIDEMASWGTLHRAKLLKR